MAIHPTAAIAPGAIIGKNVEIGPYAVVENNCIIGDNCWIDAHAKVCEYTTVGGWCIEKLEGVVREADHFEYEHLYIIVSKMQDMRIESITVIENEKTEEE